MFLVLGLVLILGIGDRSLAVRSYSRAIFQKLEEVQNKTLENTLQMEELASQVSVLCQQNQEILAILKGSHPSSSGGVMNQVEQMKTQLEELRIQIQILVKAVIALIGILIFILLYLIFRSRRSSPWSRRSSPYGRLRI